jgi:protein-S-isoprenylcysteine O-methyltransferase Ste14
MRMNPGLLNQRGKRVKEFTGTKRWDWIILSIFGLLQLLTPFIAGLDYRYQWSSPPSGLINLIGAVVLIISFVILTWSMVTNRFFEATVRIQTSNGQHVISSGPYQYVRHPGYLGVVLSFFAIPLMLGTLAAWIPALAGVLLFVLRTWLEDRTLQQELPSYVEFTRKTKHRLIPGLW